MSTELSATQTHEPPNVKTLHCEVLCRCERPGLVYGGAEFRVQRDAETGVWAVTTG